MSALSQIYDILFRHCDRLFAVNVDRYIFQSYELFPRPTIWGKLGLVPYRALVVTSETLVFLKNTCKVENAASFLSGSRRNI